jgi:hypothetical protein
MDVRYEKMPESDITQPCVDIQRLAILYRNAPMAAGEAGEAC